MSDRNGAAGRNPVSAEPLLPGTKATPWERVAPQVDKTEKFWLATARPDGRTHVRPLFAVWTDGALVFTTGPGAAKARNIAADARVSVTASCDTFDLVLEGTAVPVTGDARLQQVVDAYRAKYGWQVSVRDGDLHADYAAPTAGRPPYTPYQVVLESAYAFPSSEGFTPTRWRF